MNYEREIIIDETALDVEWLDQPRLFLKYARHFAECRKKLDLAKEKLDFIRAELDKDIRMHPERYDIAKITETVVANTILLQPEYKEANEAVIEARFEMDIASAAVRAFEQRKDALEDLVKLHGQQYFAGPKIPRDLQQEYKQRKAKQKKTDANISKKMKRK